MDRKKPQKYTIRKSWLLPVGRTIILVFLGWLVFRIAGPLPEEDGLIRSERFQQTSSFQTCASCSECQSADEPKYGVQALPKYFTDSLSAVYN